MMENDLSIAKKAEGGHPPTFFEKLLPVHSQLYNTQNHTHILSLLKNSKSKQLFILLELALNRKTIAFQGT